MVGYGGYLLFIFLRGIIINSAYLHSCLLGGLVGAEVIVEEENLLYPLAEFTGREKVYLRVGLGGRKIIAGPDVVEDIENA